MIVRGSYKHTEGFDFLKKFMVHRLQRKREGVSSWRMGCLWEALEAEKGVDGEGIRKTHFILFY